MKGPSKATGVGGSLSKQADYRRKVAGSRVDQLRPDIPHQGNAAPPIEGRVAYCPSCHAIYHPKHWHLDEAEYMRLRQDPNVTRLVCASCKAIERQDWAGQIRLKMMGLERFRDQILNTIYNEEARAREKNPHERIGKLIVEEGEITINTVSPALPHRIAALLKKTFHGTRADEDYTSGQYNSRILWGKSELMDTETKRESHDRRK